jgi:hypothetical protein
VPWTVDCVETCDYLVNGAVGSRGAERQSAARALLFTESTARILRRSSTRRIRRISVIVRYQSTVPVEKYLVELGTSWLT